MLHLLWFLPLLLLIVFLASPRFRGDIAESRVRRLLATGLQKNLYTVFNDLVLPSGGGTTRVDHVVVSKFGIFVIESAYARGWVSGEAYQAEWRQRSLSRSLGFENPVHRNRLQVDALERLLGFPASVFHPLVVLVGHKGFRKPPPRNVLEADGLLARIRKETRHLLTPEQADQAIQAIDTARLKPPGGPMLKPLTLVRLALLGALLVGSYLAFRDDVDRLISTIQQQVDQNSNPELYHPDGRRKTEQELWEDSLICAYSADTGRCACYEPGGARVEIEPTVCRRLAERGSILER